MRTLERLPRAEIALVVCAILLAALPTITGSGYHRQLVMNFAIFALLAVSLDLILGYAGQVTLGHAGLYAVGAYTSALLVMRLGLPFPVGVAGAIALTMLVGLLLGVASLRTHGLYLALITLGFGSLIEGVLINWSDVTGGHDGISGIPRPALFGLRLGPNESLYLILAIAFLTVIFVRRLVRSRTGRAFLALRESEPAARSLGIDTFRYKILAFVISSGIVGMAGALYAHTLSFVSADLSGFVVTIEAVLMVVLGGMGTLYGGLVGAGVLVVLPILLAPLERYHLLAYGAILLLVVVLMPNGVVPIITEAFARLRPNGHARPDLAAAVAGPGGGREHSGLGVAPAPRERATPAPTPPVPLLVANGVSLRFGGVQALQDVALTVARGRTHGLIGPNGSGKTSLLNVISGYYVPDAGEIRFKGDPLGPLPPEARARRGLIRTFQNLALFLELSALENVMVGCHRLNRSGVADAALRTPRHGREERLIRARAEELLALVGLEGRRDLPARHLSYGQRKLLELARALAAEPELLLLDEPAAGLHPREVDVLEQLLRRLRGMGLTLVVVEHHLDLVLGLSDTVTVLDGGAKIAEGRPADVQRDPGVIEAYIGGEVAS